MTTERYHEEHPRCKGGDGSFRYLAWLGDAVLYLVATKHLLNQNGFESDDSQALQELTVRRGSFVSRVQLWKVAQLLGLHKQVRKGREESSEWSREAERVEAVIGTIARHSGEYVARRFIHENIIIALSDDGVNDKLAAALAGGYKVPESASKFRLLLEAELGEELKPGLPRGPNPRFKAPKEKKPTREIAISVVENWGELYHKMKSFPKPIHGQIVAIACEKKGAPGQDTRLTRINAILSAQPTAA